MKVDLIILWNWTMPLSHAPRTYAYEQKRHL